MRYLLVEVIERNISIPGHFDTYEEAYAKMCEYFSEARGVAIDEIRGNLTKTLVLLITQHGRNDTDRILIGRFSR